MALNHRNTSTDDYESPWQKMGGDEPAVGQYISWHTPTGQRFGQYSGRKTKDGKSGFVVFGGRLMPIDQAQVPFTDMLTNGVVKSLPDEATAPKPTVTETPKQVQARVSKQADASQAEEVVQYILSAGEPVSRAMILANTSVDERSYLLVIKAVAADSRIQVTGVKKGTRYSPTGTKVEVKRSQVPAPVAMSLGVRVMAVLNESGEPMGRSAIFEKLGETPTQDEWMAAVKYITTERDVIVTGAKRGTKYAVK